MRMLWMMMGMYVLFVAPNLTLRRCPCVTSVSCNIVRIALTHIHVTMSRCFNIANVSCRAHKLLILILYLVDNGTERRTCVVECGHLGLRPPLFLAFRILHHVLCGGKVACICLQLP